MSSYPKNNGFKPGTWKALVDAGRMSASFVCPKCGAINPLTKYAIACDGSLSPKFSCVNLDFTDDVNLEGWIFGI